MKIIRNGSTPSAKGPASFFTGNVRIDSFFQGEEPARAGGAIVTSNPVPARSGIPIRWARP